MNEKIIDSVFPNTSQRIKDKICPLCEKPIGDFKDELSKKEYKISGMCQNCQDEMFIRK